MGKELYPPKGMDYNEWLCDLMCGDPERDEEEEDDRTEEDNRISDKTDSRK